MRTGLAASARGGLSGAVPVPGFAEAQRVLGQDAARSLMSLSPSVRARRAVVAWVRGHLLPSLARTHDATAATLEALLQLAAEARPGGSEDGDID
eukprot:87126-Chlamydomonas_euryale.AAC.1